MVKDKGGTWNVELEINKISEFFSGFRAGTGSATWQRAADSLQRNGFKTPSSALKASR
jgi:hypothetical protein